MDEDDLKHFEDRLLEEREDVLKELGKFDEEYAEDPQGGIGNPPESYSFHMADEGTDAMEREKKFHFASQEAERLYEIDRALRLLYRTPEEYGECQECGSEISHERLDAVPFARLCIQCKQREEEESGEL